VGARTVPARQPPAIRAGTEPASGLALKTGALPGAKMLSMRTVLIVDDHPGFRGLARAVLQAEGFGVVGEAADGAAAIQAVRALRPDVVLLDIQLPDMNGFEVAERLLGRGEGGTVVLISSRDAADYGTRVAASPAAGVPRQGRPVRRRAGGSAGGRRPGTGARAMTPRRWALVALAGAALVWALGGEWVSISHGVRESHLLDVTVGLSFFAAGIVALDRRPGNVIGPLMIAYAATWFLGNWSNLPIPVFPTLVFVAGLFGAPLLAHIALAYPSGRLRTRFDRVVLGTLYAEAAAVGIAGMLTFPRRSPGSSRCPWTPLFVPDRTVFIAVNRISDHSAVVLVPLVLAAIWRRWWRASQGERRELAPLWAAASLLAVVYLMGAFASPDAQDGFSYLLWELRAMLQISLPIVFVWGLLSSRLARSAVGDLVVALDRPLPPGGLQAALAQTLADPALQVVYALEGEPAVERRDRERRWVDANGLPVTLPSPDARVATVVERNGQPLAALLHDPALDPGLVRAAGAAAGMAIENERLHAQVRAQLDEVRASRARIVQASDEERLRIERNLHDGAQQRLLTLSLALHTARRQLAQLGADADPALVETVRRASEELRLAIEELRELARGIHPAILTDEGLGPALRSLASRTSVPVTLVEVPSGRLPQPIEATAYFVVSEALANLTKHAHATSASVRVRLDHDDQSTGRQAGEQARLLVEVRDDGVGGADPACGSGLRGLHDRVAAVGGRLWVTSPPGQGTVVQAWLPRHADPIQDRTGPAGAAVRR
jgi:signal transduction histidine kinase/CheY-like chemotaxis protein